MQRRLSIIAAAAVAVAACHAWVAPAQAVALGFTHPYGDLVDRGDLSAQISATEPGLLLECPSSVTRAQSGNRITLTTRQAPPGQTVSGECQYVSRVVLGALAAGAYEVTARILAGDGTTLASVTQALEVLPIEGRCNADPALSPSLIGRAKGTTRSEFIARVQTDAAFAAALGNPAVRAAPYGDDIYFDYPPLDDVPPAMDRLANSGAVESLWRNGRACFATPPPDGVGRFVEFHNIALDHYFYSGDAGEIAAIEAGKVGPGWARTGKSFRAVTEPGCYFATTDTVVYRFFGVPGAGPNSHFFTRDRAECRLVDTSGKWSFEGLPFFATPPRGDGTCAAPFAQVRVPLYRVWRPFGDSNHRFTTDRAVVATMVAQGWVDEGPAMCVLPDT